MISRIAHRTKPVQLKTDPSTPTQRLECSQIGLDQGNPQEEHVRQIVQDLSLDAAVVAVEQPLGIRGQIHIQKIHPMELAEQLDDLPLGWGVIAELLVTQLPELGHRPSAVEAAR